MAWQTSNKALEPSYLRRGPSYTGPSTPDAYISLQKYSRLAVTVGRAQIHPPDVVAATTVNLKFLASLSSKWKSLRKRKMETEPFPMTLLFHDYVSVHLVVVQLLSPCFSFNFPSNFLTCHDIFDNSNLSLS